MTILHRVICDDCGRSARFASVILKAARRWAITEDGFKRIRRQTQGAGHRIGLYDICPKCLRAELERKRK